MKQLLGIENLCDPKRKHLRNTVRYKSQDSHRRCQIRLVLAGLLEFLIKYAIEQFQILIEGWIIRFFQEAPPEPYYG